jgi:hypothetical protein
VEYPGALAIEFQYDLIIDLKRTHAKAGKSPEHLVVIASEVNHFGVSGNEPRDVLNNLHVRPGPEPFGKLPHVDYIAIQNKSFGSYGFEVAQQSLCVTTIRSKVNVRQYNKVYVSLSLLAHSV